MKDPNLEVKSKNEVMKRLFCQIFNFKVHKMS